MTSKREKLQYAYVFFADLLTMAVSVLLAWLITDGLFGVLIPYTSTDWLQTLCLLFVAFVVTFFFFDQDKNIVTRSENEEISLSLRFNIAFGLVYAGCMLLAKATMLDSRYFAVTVPAVNAVLLPFSHAILKRLLIRFQRSWGMETLVGVVTTSDRAERLISEIRKDWSRRVVGVSLLEATPAAISTRVCGVEVKATFDDFMDWIRREALDEVYVDVPMDSGESFIPYLDEMESMGLTVHFRLPLLDRIEEACCDETSAARLSRSLGRCAGATSSQWAPLNCSCATRSPSAAWTWWALSSAVSSASRSSRWSPSRLSSKAPARCFLNKSVWAATGGIFTSTSCAACTWTPRPARRS